MKPVGLSDPRTGRDPWAVVQLRKENREGTTYNMVGFQTKLTYSEQKRIFRLIPGMEHVEFARLGSIHRNTFVCAPLLLLPTLQLRARPDLLLAGQLSGVEGYVESTAMGLLAGINAARLACGTAPVSPPPETALGSLITTTAEVIHHFSLQTSTSAFRSNQRYQKQRGRWKPPPRPGVAGELGGVTLQTEGDGCSRISQEGWRARRKRG
jgi:methylenetetrahydrofolate--tRNA-(uracil-5-)-methyltransferase